MSETNPIEQPGDAAPMAMPFDFSDMMFEEPSVEAMEAAARQRYDRVSPYHIDQWPESVRALSFPTKMIEIDVEEMRALFDYHAPDWKQRADVIAKQLDDAMDWGEHFVRLNTRSPKDVVDKPITCSGRQAVHWISLSERCMDDVSTAYRSKTPIYICLRETRHLFVDGEFRCFAKDGEMIAVSRYFYNVEPQHRMDGDEVFASAKAFYETHLREHYRDVVFDLYAPGTDQQVMIELNPYGLSDPCLFGDYASVEQGGARMG